MRRNCNCNCNTEGCIPLLNLFHAWLLLLMMICGSFQRIASPSQSGRIRPVRCWLSNWCIIAGQLAPHLKILRIM
jgi:hypothetical protein